MAYAPPADPEVDAYFEAVATRINDQLTACGFGPDNAGVLARNREWMMSSDEWSNVFETCLEQPDHSHLIRAAVSFDFRPVVGALDIASLLVSIERRAPSHPGFLRRLARTATDFPTPLGRRNRISTDKDGAFDIKKQGVVPVANLARFHAISVGSTISPTLDRLAAAAQGGAITESTHSELVEAFGLIVRMRLEHQAEQVEQGLPLDDRIHPDRLTPLTRGLLVQAFQVVAAQQKLLARFVPLGI
jgi:CBS domain-containing protein